MNKSTAKGRRLPAEWELHGAILLSWPHADTDWAPMLDEVTRCYVELAHKLADYTRLVIVAPDTTPLRELLADIPTDKLILLDVPTNDTWARDFGPITAVDSADLPVACDFTFNGWGLKFAADKDNLVNRALYANGLLDGNLDNCLGFVLEGGSVETDGCGTLLTTSRCLLSPNRNGSLSRGDIERHLSAKLGFTRFHWLEHGALEGDDTDSHIDTLARLAPNNTIIYCGPPADSTDSHYAELTAMRSELQQLRTASGIPYNLIELPLPDPVYDDEENRLPATYANYLATPKAIFMPTYRQPANDLLASKILRIAFPGCDIVTVDCVPLVKQHGSLHCATMQINPL